MAFRRVSRGCYSRNVLNLLVVDFDYFFPNPMENDEATLDSLFYDWSHRETNFHIDSALWTIRASGFLANGLPLPPCQGTDGFWDRFTLPSTPLLVGDSNVHAGALAPPPSAGRDRFDHVWLYDAHHDSGYHGGTVEQWRKDGRYTCEDWAVAHHLTGSKVHTRYPRWRSNAFRLEPEPMIDIDRAFDDSNPNPVAFDLAYLCRSGAWVPPWCDNTFADLVRAYPGEHTVVDGRPLVRDFDLATAVRISDAQMQVMAPAQATT